MNFFVRNLASISDDVHFAFSTKNLYMIDATENGDFLKSSQKLLSFDSCTDGLDLDFEVACSDDIRKLRKSWACIASLHALTLSPRPSPHHAEAATCQLRVLVALFVTISTVVLPYGVIGPSMASALVDEYENAGKQPRT